MKNIPTYNSYILCAKNTLPRLVLLIFKKSYSRMECLNTTAEGAAFYRPNLKEIPSARKYSIFPFYKRKPQTNMKLCTQNNSQSMSGNKEHVLFCIFHGCMLLAQFHNHSIQIKNLLSNLSLPIKHQLQVEFNSYNELLVINGESLLINY